MNVKRTKIAMNRTRCYHFTRAGRRCRLLVIERHALYCPRHRRAAEPTPRAHDFSELFAHGAGLFTDASSIHRGLAMIFHALATNDISSRRAAVLTYIASQLLRTLPLLAPAQNAADEECEFIVPPRGAVGYDSEPCEIIVDPDHDDSPSVASSSSSVSSFSSSVPSSSLASASSSSESATPILYSAGHSATSGTEGTAHNAHCAPSKGSSVKFPAALASSSDAAGIAQPARRAQNEMSSGGFSPSDFGGPILHSAGHSATSGVERTAPSAFSAHDNSSPSAPVANHSASAHSRSAVSSTSSAGHSATSGVADAAPIAQCAQEKSRAFHNPRAAVSYDATFGATGTAPAQLPPACHLRGADLEFDRAVREALTAKRARTDSPLLNWPRHVSFRRGRE